MALHVWIAIQCSRVFEGINVFAEAVRCLEAVVPGDMRYLPSSDAKMRNHVNGSVRPITYLQQQIFKVTLSQWPKLYKGIQLFIPS